MGTQSNAKTGRPNIGDLLMSEGLIDKTQLAVALAEQRQWGHRVGVELVRLGFVVEEELIRVLGRQMGLPIVRLAGKRVDREILDLVPQSLAEKHRCIPLFFREEGGSGVLQLAVEDPANVEALDELRFALDLKFTPVLVSPTDLDDALRRNYRGVTEQAAAELLEDTDLGAGEGLAPREQPAREPGLAKVAPSGRVPAVPPAVMLRALAQLLVENGIFAREELIERIEQLTAETEGGSR
jgi:type II secretory ATPase GspE/PulE/Tfp pilus assembly ATPase PilB-like protein